MNIPVIAGNTLLVISWCLFSFLFWRGLRRWGIEEDRIFDLTFYSTLTAFVMARLVFVVTNWYQFAGKSLLLIPALWIAPGLSWIGALVGGIATLTLLSRQYKVRLGLVLDSLPFALLAPVILGEVVSFLQSSEIGKVTLLPWGVRVIGHTGLRHPVQGYEIFFLAALWFFLWRIAQVAVKKKWAYGVVGVWFFLLYSVGMFSLEFAKDTPVYWGRLTANQWILIGIFAECIGVLYVRGGGRESLRPVFRAVHSAIIQKGKAVYATISKRHINRTKETS